MRGFPSPRRLTWLLRRNWNNNAKGHNGRRVQWERNLNCSGTQHKMQPEESDQQRETSLDLINCPIFLSQLSQPDGAQDACTEKNFPEGSLGVLMLGSGHQPTPPWEGRELQPKHRRIFCKLLGKNGRGNNFLGGVWGSGSGPCPPCEDGSPTPSDPLRAGDTSAPKADIP